MCNFGVILIYRPKAGFRYIDYRAVVDPEKRGGTLVPHPPPKKIIRGIC